MFIGLPTASDPQHKLPHDARNQGGFHNLDSIIARTGTAVVMDMQNPAQSQSKSAPLNSGLRKRAKDAG
jgi:hypothetical protein